MKLKHVVLSLLVAVAAGCDSMEQDVDGKALTINNDPAYFLPNGGLIDLPSRIIAPGKVKVEITTSTSNGELRDLGNGLLQYSPFKGSTNDFFRFRVTSDNNRVLADDSIGIIIPPDTAQLPCTHVYVRNDSVVNVTGIVLIDVSANDYSCGSDVHLTIEGAAQHGHAAIMDNGKIRYEPNETFTGTDQFLYRSVIVGHIETAGYGIVYVTKLSGPSNPGCTTLAVDDLFYKPKNDSSTMPLDVLANDTICDGVMNVTITAGPRVGFASYDNSTKKILYRNVAKVNTDDTLRYMACGPNGCSAARVLIKRN